MSAELRLQSFLHLAHCPAHPQRPYAQKQHVLQRVPVAAGSAPPGPSRHLGCVVAVGPWWDPPAGSSDPDFFQHAHKCPQLVAARSARHHILCGAWCQFMQSAGVPTSLEPICSKVAGAHPVTTGVRADILTVLLLDASVTYCCADTCIERAAATAGSAPEVRAQKKVRKYALHGPGGYDFTLFVVVSMATSVRRPTRCSTSWGTLLVSRLPLAAVCTPRCRSLYCVLFVFSCSLWCCGCPCSCNPLLCAPVDCDGCSGAVILLWYFCGTPFMVCRLFCTGMVCRCVCWSAADEVDAF